MNRELLWACLIPASTPKVGGNLYLTVAPISAECGTQVRFQDLHSHLSLMLQVLSEIHRSHPATTEFPLDGVAVGQSRGEA